MDIGIALAAPVHEFDAELVGALGRGKEIGFVDAQRRGDVAAGRMVCVSAAAPAWPQSTEGAPATGDAQTTEDTIVVQGYRQWLQSAQSLKKNADVIGESVTAEDIGAVAARSVTETLQRIPGV